MYLKHGTTDDQTRQITARIKAIDYELMAIASGPNCPLTLKAADKLARMHRSLRELRHLIEIEAGQW